MGDLSIDAYFCKIESIANVLKGLRSPMSDKDIVNIAFEGLPTKYDNVYGINVHRVPFPDLKMVCSMLTTEEMRLKSRAQDTFVDSTSSSPMVLLANSGANTWRGYEELQSLLAKFSYGTNSLSISNSTSLPSQNKDKPVALQTTMNPVFASVTSPSGFNTNSTAQSVQYGIAPQAYHNPAQQIQQLPSPAQQDFLTRRVLLCCDSTGDLYPVTNPSTIPHAFLAS
ncbi:hypothetical protein Tco_0860711 [Tanacetum coccineum]|uniref:Hybrid signal transduction histidine kinase M n=1 Tax=Tanacetum coccineum TaxID=301880 RepID=A0ABQ5BHG1_9ASTR